MGKYKPLALNKTPNQYEKEGLLMEAFGGMTQKGEFERTQAASIQIRVSSSSTTPTPSFYYSWFTS